MGFVLLADPLLRGAQVDRRRRRDGRGPGRRRHRRGRRRRLLPPRDGRRLLGGRLALQATGVAGVEIVKGTTVLASRHQSAHAPTIRLAELPTFGINKTVVRWSAHDADNDPVEVKISYSGDDGHTWNLVWMGPNLGRVTLPARYLFSSRRARIRVEVNDGFRTAIATSRRFRTPREAPSVSILLPVRRFHQPNDAPLVLSGQAFDDRSRQVTGRQLRWMLGRRLLGTGTRSRSAAHRPGETIELLARDKSGRVGRASVVVRLGAARPLFLKLGTPRSVRRAARSLRITVSSSVSATLIVHAPGLPPCSGSRLTDIVDDSRCGSGPGVKPSRCASVRSPRAENATPRFSSLGAGASGT